MRGFSHLEEAAVAVAAREDDGRRTTRSSLVWEVEEGGVWGLSWLWGRRRRRRRRICEPEV